MEQLEYSKKWLEYGLIDEGDVCKQYEIFLESEDKNTEHYRYSSFMKLLKKIIFYIQEIKQYIEVARVDKDQIMATSAILELICYKFLTEEQFISLLVYSGSQKSEVCPMPYALCPMPYALCPMPYSTSSF